MISKLSRKDLRKTKFKLINSLNLDTFFEIIVTEFQNDGVQGSMIQFIDVSMEIMLEKEKEESRHLAMTNAQVSHELRNPLNSIIAHNIER
jgi:signal transduction histidine kinase